MNQTTELIKYILRDNYDKVSQLLDQGVDPNELDFDNKSPLHIAVYYFRDNMLKLLIDKGADVNFAGMCYTTCFGECEWPLIQYAIYCEYYMCVDILLEAGANLSNVNFGGMTALEYAKLRGYHRMIDLIEQYEVPVKGVYE